MARGQNAVKKIVERVFGEDSRALALDIVVAGAALYGIHAAYSLAAYYAPLLSHPVVSHSIIAYGTVRVWKFLRED